MAQFQKRHDPLTEHLERVQNEATQNADPKKIILDGVNGGSDNEVIIKKLMDKCGLSKAEATKMYNKFLDKMETR